MGFKVAVVGATGNVGREMLTTLAERDFPADDVVALASSRSIGREVSFGEDDILKVQGLDTFDFHGHRHRACLRRAPRSRRYLRRARPRPGAVVIDNTSLLPHGAGRAAGGAGGQPAGDRAVHQARHHRQPELLDDPDGGGAEAAARPGADQAGGRRDLPVGLGRRPRGDGRAVQPDPRDLRQRSGQAGAVHQADRVQRDPAYRRLHGRRRRPRKSGRWRSRPARFSTPTSR